MRDYNRLHDRIADFGLNEARLGIYTYGRPRMRILFTAQRAILAVWIFQLHRGTLDLAGLFYVLRLTDNLFTSFWRFAHLIERTSEATEGVKRLLSIVEAKAQVIGAAHKPKAVGPDAVGIEFRDVSFAYPCGYLAIDSLDLSIEPGELVALVGPSGSGKSTLWRLIPRLYDIQRGRVLVNGVDVRQWPIEQLRALFSCMPQGDEAFLFDTTIAENIRFSRPDASDEDVELAARLAEIHDDILLMPEEYNSRVGERGSNLSGGQRQRIALARTLLAERPMLILDEYTNELDSVTEKRIQDNLREYLQGRSGIIIAHRLSTVAEIADKIVVLQSGRKVEEGPHCDLVQRGGLYAEMAELQVLA